MLLLIKLFYAAALAALLILVVAFGIRTFYGPPEAPVYPGFPAGYRPPGPTIDGATPELTPEQEEAIAAQERYQEEYEVYREELEGYHARVFIVATLVGIAAVAGGILVGGALDAIRLGLVAGGLGTILYGTIQAGGDIDAAGPGIVFGLTVAGLLLVLAAGVRWLSRRGDEAGERLA